MEDTKFQKIFSMFNFLHINFLVVEAMIEMPGYAKFMKELVTNKRTLECEMIEVLHNCSAILINTWLLKRMTRCIHDFMYNRSL